MLASVYIIEEYVMIISRLSGPSVDATALHPIGVNDSAEMIIKIMMNNFFKVLPFDVLLTRFILIISVYRQYLNSIGAPVRGDSILSSDKLLRLAIDWLWLIDTDGCMIIQLVSCFEGNVVDE